MPDKSISRRSRKISEIKARCLYCTRDRLGDGPKVKCDPDEAWRALENGLRPKLWILGEDRYRIEIHHELSYDLSAQPRDDPS